MTARIVRVVAIAAVAAGTLHGAHAQQPRDQPRAAAGTAAISGVVVAADDGRTSLARAVVSLTAAELPLGRATISDDQGRFAFANLPAGRFTLKASKGGYLPTTLGTRQPGQPGTLLAVADGERMTGVTVRMPRGAVISGTVTSPTGEPLPGLQVTALSMHSPESQTFSLVAPGFVTDDRGTYRIFGLAAGEYYVAAAPPRAASSAAPMRSAEEIDAIFRRLRAMTQATSTVPGAPAPAAPAAPAPSDAAPVVGYVPFFFRGTPNAADATIVRVAAGEERSGVDIVVDRVRTATIEGIVTNPHGPLPSIQLSILPLGPRLPGVYGGAPTLAERVGPDGRFTYTGVGPGRYIISARATAGSSPPGGGRAAGGFTAPSTSAPAAGSLWATEEIAVQGEDVGAVTLELRPSLRVTGRARFNGAPPSPDSGPPIRLTLVREGGGGSAAMNNTTIGYPGVSPAVVRPDGTFEFVGAFPGTYRLSAVVDAPLPWRLRSAIVDGRDILDVPLVIEGRDVPDVALTFSDTESEVSGTVQIAAGRPEHDTTVIVFSSDPSLWRPGARRIRTAAADSDGRYAVRGLPAGEYLIALVADLEAYQFNDRAYLQRLAASALKISLADGEKKQQDLHLR